MQRVAALEQSRRHFAETSHLVLASSFSWSDLSCLLLYHDHDSFERSAFELIVLRVFLSWFCPRGGVRTAPSPATPPLTPLTPLTLTLT